MVMHARKLPRLNDGYFDKNQSHSYESSNKYLKSSERNSEKIREALSCSNSEGSGRNDSVDHRNSPRCHKSYAQRLKEKDHHDDASSKSPAMKLESRSSGKEMHKSSSLDSEGSSVYQSNHDRNNTEESERRLQAGDWSEHISSSGKKYYYNCKTEISQWEKPKELIEYERQQNLARLSHDLSRSRDRLHDRQSSASGSKNAHCDDVTTSPENCEPYSCRSDAVPHKNSYLPMQHSASTQSTHVLSPSQVTLSNLPKLISQLAGTKGLPNLSELSPQEALKTIQQALQLTQQVTNLSQSVTAEINVQKSPGHSQNQVIKENHHPVGIPTNSSSSCNSCIGHVNLNSTSISTSSLQQQQQQPVLEDKPEVDTNGESPESDSSTQSSRHDSPTSSVSSLQSLGATGTSSLATAGTKRSSSPTLTASLVNYYREDLITHVVGWQADHAERQANRYSEDSYNISSMNCSQVSTELKMARSLVRLAEIQATLREQRILFLRQQTKELDDWRSLNSFMSDS